MKSEEEARKDIDQLFEAAGWKLQNYKDLNLGAGVRVALRDFPLKIEHADYMLFMDRHAVGLPVFAFHQHETWHEWLYQEDTLRDKLISTATLTAESLRDCQKEAIGNSERSFALTRSRACIQMASEDIVSIIRKESRKGNEFSEKIAYWTTGVTREDI